ncbi:helix-turn-helix domain-containing protein [Edaphobacillus lindanitolerans]|uniref:Helix-turn-helix domain-containing protein n=1 Tax=Edaphobacillus lindanitolerans TaxID=550447 RepID=A0A1U7PMY4_9BACI|nr:helix-turn-helix transcriptional regulator [Edaphobacillus lindanitolerans]SIT91515.1 Helix-turn-helix domain-containing protein [Edaphobacillus lindanitolerans]
MKYGAVLKAARERHGLSQEELAHHLHIQQADVSRIENNRREPSMSLFRDWTVLTQAQDVMVAFICGMDGLTILQNIMSVVIGFIGGWMI